MTVGLEHYLVLFLFLDMKTIDIQHIMEWKHQMHQLIIVIMILLIIQKIIVQQVKY